MTPRIRRLLTRSIPGHGGGSIRFRLDVKTIFFVLSRLSLWLFSAAHVCMVDLLTVLVCAGGRHNQIGVIGEFEYLVNRVYIGCRSTAVTMKEAGPIVDP